MLVKLPAAILKNNVFSVRAGDVMLQKIILLKFLAAIFQKAIVDKFLAATFQTKILATRPNPALSPRAALIGFRY